MTAPNATESSLNENDEPLRELCFDYRNADTLHAENYFQRIVRWVRMHGARQSNVVQILAETRGSETYLAEVAASTSTEGTIGRSTRGASESGSTEGETSQPVEARHYRHATHAENLRCIVARLSEHLAIAEVNELEAAAAVLESMRSAVLRSDNVHEELRAAEETIWQATGSALLAGEKCKKSDAGVIRSSLCVAGNQVAAVREALRELSREDVEDIKEAIGKAYPSIDDMTRETLCAKVDRLAVRPKALRTEVTSQPLICSHCGELFDALDREQTAKGTAAQSNDEAEEAICTLEDELGLALTLDELARCLDAVAALKVAIRDRVYTKADAEAMCEIAKATALKSRSAVSAIPSMTAKLATRLEQTEAVLRKINERRCTNPKPVGDSACECCTHHWHAIAMLAATPLVDSSGSTTQAKCIGYMRSFNSDQCLRCGASEASHAADVRTGGSHG